MSSSEKEINEDDDQDKKVETDTDDIDIDDEGNTDLSDANLENDQEQNETEKLEATNEVADENVEEGPEEEVGNDEENNNAQPPTSDIDENGDQENQSARRKVSRSASRRSLVSPHQSFYTDMETLEELPDNCVPIFLSKPTLNAFSIDPDTQLSAQHPKVKLNKEDIVKDMQARAAVSDFSVLKSEIQAYDGTEILLLFDEEFKFGQNFIIALTEEGKESILNIITKVSQTPDPKKTLFDEDKLPDMIVGNYVPPSSKKWICLGSDKEILETRVTLVRENIKTLIRRPRREFNARDYQFDIKGSTKDYCEVPSIEDNRFTLVELVQDKNESNTTTSRENSTNTIWKRPRNAFTQYEARELTAEECDAHMLSTELFNDFRNALPYFIETIQQNEITNYFIDDYGSLTPGDTVFDNKTDNDLREFQTFADLKFGKDKAVSHIEWHPTIKGILVTSMIEKTSFDTKIDNLSKVILTKSYIMIWTFLDPMQPLLLLEAPADITCFQINPTDPNLIVGGCVNGQIILWDIENHMDDLRNVKTKLKQKHTISLFSFDAQDGPFVPKIKYVAVSHIESSHSAPITDIQWLPDHYEINYLGYSKENFSMKSVQLASAATDHKIYFWDIREKKAQLAPADKMAHQMPPVTGLPDTYQFLDMKWKPTLKVQLFKTPPGGDFAPTKFSLREVQGDRRVLEELEDKENKEEFKPIPGKERTLQDVNTHIYVGTEDGELVYVDWMPQKDADSSKYQTPKPEQYWSIHDGPITTVQRSPFDRGLLLIIGGWRWSIWKEGINSGPILQCCTSAKPLTGGCWSPTRSSVFFVIRSDGNVEIWDLLDRTHEPGLIQNISSSSALTSVSVHNFVKKQLLAIGDISGTLHVYEVPVRFKQHSQTELNDTMKYIDREVKRRDFVQMRWNLREKEKIERDNEAKKKAGIAPQVVLTDDEIKIRMKVEYDVFLMEEQAFLREMGLKEDSDEEHESEIVA